MRGVVVTWLVHSTPDRAAWVQALSRDIVMCSWARHFTLTVPIFAQVYKWVPANLMLILIPVSPTHPNQGEGGGRVSPHATATGKSSGLMGQCARMQTWPFFHLDPYALWNQGGLRPVLRAELSPFSFLCVFWIFSFLAPDIFGRKCRAVLFTGILFLCSDTRRKHCAREIWQGSFISTVRPTIHTNPSWKRRMFSKTLFKPDKFENVGFPFACGR